MPPGEGNMLSILTIGFSALLLMLSVTGTNAALSETDASANNLTSWGRAADGFSFKERSPVGARGIIMAAEKMIQRRQVPPRKLQRMKQPRMKRVLQGNKGTFDCFCSGAAGKCSAVVVDQTLYCEKGNSGGCSGKCSLRIKIPGAMILLEK